MPIFDSHLNQLKERQNLPGIHDFTDILLPNYDGFGLANLTPSISRWLGGPELSAPVFSDAILDQFAPKYKRVVLLLVDAADDDDRDGDCDVRRLLRSDAGRSAPLGRAGADDTGRAVVGLAVLRALRAVDP